MKSSLFSIALVFVVGLLPSLAAGAETTRSTNAIVDRRLSGGGEAFPVTPSATIGSEEAPAVRRRSLLRTATETSATNPSEGLPSGAESLTGSAGILFRGGHRSLGGGSNTKNNTKNRFLEQDWARDENGVILWWIWLIIGLSIVLFCIVCCCASSCCLRD